MIFLNVNLQNIKKLKFLKFWISNDKLRGPFLTVINQPQLGDPHQLNGFQKKNKVVFKQHRDTKTSSVTPNQRRKFLNQFRKFLN